MLISENILYDLDKWDLRPESKVSLDGLVKTLNDNPTIVIKIMSHTDTRSDDKYNLQLSQKRAQSVVNYLIEESIASDRLEAKGYGEKKLLINDAKIKKLNTEEEREAAHQKNRRTDFKVLSDDFKKWLKENPDLGGEEKAIQRASIDEEGKVIPTREEKPTGNFLEQIN